MNSRKSKPKKRKLSDLEEFSEGDSNDKPDDVDSDIEGENSEDEEGSSSDGSMSSTESQASSESSIKVTGRRKASAVSALLSDSSESGDESCEKCAICLRSITSQEVGNPEVCDHLFCSVCILEWSKNSNVCPLDRQQFSIILVRQNKDGTVAKRVSVEEPQGNRVDNVELEELDETVCEICGSGDREDIMLLCDICDRGFHTVCLTPPLENIPDENEWFCPDCDYRAPNSTDLADFYEICDVPSTSRSLRPRIQMVRTRLLERIRVTVNRIVDNYVLQHFDDLESDEEDVLETGEEESFSESDLMESEDQPGTSGLKKSQPRKRKATRSRTSSKKKTRRKRKTTTTTKRKTTTGKRKTKRRKARVKTTRTKKVKVENADGTITEKIVKTRTYKKRRKQKTKKYKLKVHGARRGLRVKSATTPKTVKGRLALTLGMVPPRKPGQLLPDIKVRPPNSHISAIDLNRARAGIPKLHIFGPRDELQYYSSESEHEDVGIGSASGGGVATVAPHRTNVSRLRDRKKAALALQSAPMTAAKPKPAIEPPASEYVDILGSILDSQAIWHSKNTNVKIKEDGSIEVIRDKDSNNVSKVPKGEASEKIDVREGKVEGAVTQAPMYPGAGSRAGGFRPYNRTGYGESRTGQDSAFGPRTAQSSTGVNFNRFGGPARNEGYTNYVNNIPQGPTPFCRGGPPLRFRMPARQQLRRITFPARNRPAWQPEEEGNEAEKEEKKNEGETAEQTQSKSQEDEDIDLYSDIETSVEKGDNSGAEDGGPSYPALGPPPEPSAFLLGLDENGGFGVAENKDKSEVYDPAEPCDSEEEMVIDENKEQTPERKEPEQKSKEPVPPAPKPEKANSQKESSEDDDEDCPIFSIYSSATREFSQKEEEERQREIAEEKKKLEEIKLQDDQKSVDVEETEEGLGKVTKPKADESQKDVEPKEKESSREEASPRSRRESRSRSKSVADDRKGDRRSHSSESEKGRRSKSPSTPRDKSSSPDRKYKRSKRKSKDYDSESDVEGKKGERHRRKGDDDKENEDSAEVAVKRRGASEEEEKGEKAAESDSETVSQKVATGLEGLDVEEVSSDNGDGAEFGDKRSLSSLSLSELSNGSKRSRSPVQAKKRKKNKKRKPGRSKSGKNYEEGEIDDSEKDNRLDESFGAGKNEEVGNENVSKQGEKKRRKSDSGSERQILGSKENKKVGKAKSKDKDLSWKKPSKKEKNYREGKKRSKDRGRSRSTDRRKSKSPTPKKDKKKSKDRKKKTDKKKDIERYDVRKIVKNKEVRKTDAFGRDIVSKSRSITLSRSRSPIRERTRNMLRRDSRSYSRSRSRSFRRGRSPVRRRYLRSRTRTRSKSLRRSYSRSRSRSRSRKSKKKLKSKDRLKMRSRSRGRKSRSISRGRRRSPSKSRSRSPLPRVLRGKKRSRRSWSHHASRSPSFSPRRSRSLTRSPIRVRRSYSRSVSTSWSRGRSPLPRTSSLEKLTVVLTTKDKKKWKKKKEGKKSRREEKKRKKSGNSKEVFASGDNVLVSVNFRNNNNSTGNNSGSLISNDGRNARLNSLSPGPGTDAGTTTRKKKKGSDYENERAAKKSKKSNPISKKAVDVALSNACPKRAKKLTRLSEKDAEVILNRKPVAVIDLDMSPYREQTPSPVNVVVVSDSGSGDEGKEHTPQRPAVRGTPGTEADKTQEPAGVPTVDVSAPSSPLENGYVPTSGPKTPPEPQIKFSINKPQALRQIANPLGDDDDDEEEPEEEEAEPRMESLDRRIEKELNPRSEAVHKGPNTPPAPRGPSTPKTPPSPQTSPDAYDPFEPTKSRSPSPSQADKENRPSPKADGKEEQPSAGAQGEGAVATVSSSTENVEKVGEVTLENHEDKSETVEKSEAIPAADGSSNAVIPGQATSVPVSDAAATDSPERKIAVVITTPQSKTPTPAQQKAYPPVLKTLPMVSSAPAAPASASLAASSDAFSLPSPTKTSRAGGAATTAQMTGIQRLQHRLGSPVNRTPNSVKSTPEKRATPRADSNEIFSSGNYKIRNAGKRNGEQGKQPRPLQDATNETIDITMDMDDSPYSPASSEGDDLFDPPVETAKPSQSNSKAAASYKGAQKPPHKSPVKQLSKFDLLFGPSGPALSPLKAAGKKSNAKTPAKAPVAPKVLLPKPQKKAAAKKNIMHKMDEDQLRILDELPSSAVELQVKDKFLKKLNRQERVVDEVKTVLKPHYARKHITKEEYKDILRRSVPKICHSRSGEINPSKIQSLIEAYVRKFRHAKKKGLSVASKPKVKATMFS